MNLAPYRKAAVAACGVLGQIVALGLLDGTALKIATVILAAATLAGVYQVGNADETPRPARSRRTNARRGRDDDLPGGAGHDAGGP